MTQLVRQLTIGIGCISLLWGGYACKSARQVPLVGLQNIETPRLSEEDKRKFDTYFLEAQRMKFTEKYDAEFDLLKHCLAIDSTSASLHFNLADNYIKQKNPTAAFLSLRKASALEPDNYWYLYSYAGLAQSLTMKDEALKAYTLLVEKNPDKPELKYSLTEAYTQKEDYTKAIQVLNNLENQVGLSEDVSLEKFRLYALLNQSAKAYQEIEKLIAGFPRDVRYRILLGDLYLDNNMKAEALNCYLAAKEIEPNNGFLSVSLSNYYDKMGDKVVADKYIREALYNPTADVESKTKILTNYLTARLDKPEEMSNIVMLFDSLTVMHPQEESFYQLYAEYLSTQKKLPEAREKLRFAVGLEPTNIIPWRQLLNVNLQLTDYSEVISTCDKAMGYFPKVAEFSFYKGTGLFLSGNYKAAIEAYRKGIQVVDPKNGQQLSDFYGQIGDVFQQAEKPDSAYAAYEKALEYNEKNIVVLNNYAYYLSVAKKNLEKAESMSGKVINLDSKNSTYLDTYAWIFFVQKKYTLARFYIEKAMENGGDKSDVITEHYGDILYMSGEKEKALELWKKSLEMGNKSATLKKKTETGVYVE